ncbi:hypothetical protein GV828_00535 [Flavobacterium sp. NST-5]|uniref:Lipoprotein n=1 Tax=Flavobacterium ichthyis TaxID=2698827 RepID=A0ABW9Z769_9FLAO|nr:hypothetical protein [Flavobacterium ichthyis]NBL63679.1 hypothetical protein [Flavobacterium ichthyis]
MKTVKLKIEKFSFILFFCLLLNCQTKDSLVIDDLINVSQNNENKMAVKILYSPNEIEIVESVTLDKKYSDTTLLKKYNSSFKENTNGREFNTILILSDTLYSKEDFANRTDNLIAKVHEDFYVSIEDVYGTSNYRRVIFYDNHYKIYRIEISYGNKKYVFKSIIFKKKFKNLKFKRNDLNYQRKMDSIKYRQNFWITR